jgi:hypothetical protein
MDSEMDKTGRKVENGFLLGNWWVQQGVALGARFPPVSIKDYLLVAI